MNRETFLRELERQLQDLTEEERSEVLRYYGELFAEAAPEEEAEILEHLGSPETVAAELREALREEPQENGAASGSRESGTADGAQEDAQNGSGTDASGKARRAASDAGEFTERGYRDSRFEDYQAPVRYTGRRKGGRDGDRGRTGKSDRARDGLLLLILFLIFGIPLAGTIISAGFSVAAGIAGGLLGILGGMAGLIFAGFAAAFGLLVSGVIMVVVGIFNLTSPAMGLMLMCYGFLMLSAAMLFLIAAKWGCTTAVPGVVRFSVGLLRRFAGWIKRLFRRIFGRGGAAA